MKWEEFNSDLAVAKRYVLTDIQCPVCGERIYMDTGMVLTTFPEQYQYECVHCGWYGGSHRKWEAKP